MSAIVYDTAEAAFAWYLSRTITRGRLTLHTRTRTHCFPTSLVSTENVEPDAELTVYDRAFFLKLLSPAASPDLVFAEAYMRGDVSFKSRRDMVRFFEIFILNRDKPLPSLPTPLATLLSVPIALLTLPARALAGLASSDALSTARRNISAHYDLGNAMFKVFLSRDMTYSCAIFPSLDADAKVASSESSPSMGVGALDGADAEPDALHDAQIRKLQHIIRKADIQPGHRVLEIGSGWGSLALQIVRTIPDTTVDTITLSTEQAEYIQELLLQDSKSVEKMNGNSSQMAIGDRLRVHLMDFRVLPQTWEGVFDRVVSVEMVEAIGPALYEVRLLRLKALSEVVSLTSITAAALLQDDRLGTQAGHGRRRRAEHHHPGGALRRVHQGRGLHPQILFPGGVLPTVTQLTSAVVSGSAARLVVESVTNIGPHYARTLREWRRRFEAGFRSIEDALKEKYPEVMNDTEGGQQEIAMFRRKWVYYFCYCEAGFNMRVLGDYIVTFSREGNVEYSCETFA
ncbi:hypothetical protein PsYK624_109180 [Phanerochaete sordida]|uniref:Cyclopropane-fatty-acyl-phospholipid synthase n=1 Tax=Phanerochaete sordida TaxID=48140 RepID=A0A9P3GFJ8_9APHY|nr:hypothetical protein PsYK624_109180 [Phanerochaete sordida]